MNIEKKLPKPKLRYYHLQDYWTCRGHGASTAAYRAEIAYKEWANWFRSLQCNSTT